MDNHITPATQLPLGIPAVAKWYEDVERHMERGDNHDYERCAGCRRLRDRMAVLKVKYADQLVTL